MLNRLFFALLFLLCTLHATSVTRTSAGSGNWTAGGTWVGGAVPACGDSIVILNGHNVAVNTSQDYFSACGTKMAITLTGTLSFNSGRKLFLPCNSRLYVFATGLITVNGGGSSNTIDICGSTVWSSTSGNITGPSCLPPTLPGCATVLPIELQSFFATVCGNKVCLNWTTASEHNNAEMCVYKTLDGAVQHEVECVASKALNGTSSSSQNYQVIDKHPYVGTAYYRLKQIDLDGSTKFSDYVAVTYSSAEPTKISILPNPSEGQFTLVASNELVNVRLALYDVFGKEVDLKEIIRSSSISFHDVSAGVYYCKVNASNYSGTHKIIVR